MTDYSDFKKWRSVEMYTDEVYLSEHTEYQPEDVLKICEDAILKAKEAGLEGCYLQIRSTMESYEDFLGPVAITPCGYRPLNKEEKFQQQEDDVIENLAKSKGISIFEARNLYNLVKKGVVEL